MEGENSGTFSENSLSNDTWQNTVIKFENILSEWEQRLKAADDSVLSHEAFEGFGGNWYEVFAQTTIHNAYHIGQIVTIRKQQGSWNSDNGVK
jgi:inosine/xanthosine triphosphate pyrophosphatase family protein